MDSGLTVKLQLPPGDHGLRWSLEHLSEFAVTDHADGLVSIAPLEGAGVVRRYFKTHKIADAGTDLSADATWSPLAVHPPTDRPQMNLPSEVEERVAALGGSELPSTIRRLAVSSILSRPDELRAKLAPDVAQLLRRYPNGSFWYVSVDQVLMRRLTFLRIALQLQLAPDLPLGSGRGGVAMFGAHQLTRGIMFSDALKPALLTFSPSVSGFVLDAAPGAFVFLFGEFAIEHGLRLREPEPLARLFYPAVNNHHTAPGTKLSVENLAVVDLQSLLAWWTTRLNIFYSYAADPTSAPDEDGFHDPAGRTAWLSTFERLVADPIALSASMEAPGL